MTNYFAVHQIQYYDGEQMLVVEPGNLVGGLDEKEAKRLFDSGALSDSRPESLTPVAAPVHPAPSVQEQVHEARVNKTRDELEARASELDVKFSKAISDEKLAERVAEAELGA